MEWLSTTDHRKSARHAIVFFSVLLVAGIVGIFLPGSDEPTRRGLGSPIWGVAVFLVALASFALVLALLQRRREKLGEQVRSASTTGRAGSSAAHVYLVRVGILCRTSSCPTIPTDMRLP